MILRKLLLAFLLVNLINSGFAQTTSTSVFVNIYSTTPQAQIFVNDVERGTDSCIVRLLPGPCQIRVERKGWHDREITVTIGNEKEQTVQIPAMEQMFATLDVDYKPYGSTVYINGEEKGETPLTLKLPVEIYGLKIEQEGFEAYNAPVVLKYEDQQLRIEGTLKKGKASTQKGKNEPAKGKAVTAQQAAVLGKDEVKLPNALNFHDISYVESGGQWYKVTASFHMPQNTALSKLVTNFLFSSESDQVISTYHQQIKKFDNSSSLKRKSEDRTIDFSVRTRSEKPDKYLNITVKYLKKWSVKDYDKHVLREINYLYDVKNDKFLNMDDVLVAPEAARKRKQMGDSLTSYLFMKGDQLLVLFPKKNKNGKPTGSVVKYAKYSLTHDKDLLVNDFEKLFVDQPTVQHEMAFSASRGVRNTGKTVEPIRRDFFFDTNTWVLNDVNRKKASQIAEYLKQYECAMVTITGFADASTEMSNKSEEISKKRVIEVKNILVNDYGIPESRISIDWKGNLIQPFADHNYNRVAIAIAEPAQED